MTEDERCFVDETGLSPHYLIHRTDEGICNCVTCQHARKWFETWKAKRAAKAKLDKVNQAIVNVTAKYGRLAWANTGAVPSSRHNALIDALVEIKEVLAND